MKNSRTSLNKPFYDWIKEIREADKKIEELEDKLYYYNVKLIGYNSPNFEPRLSSTKPEYKDNRYIWIEKILNTENEISNIKQIKKKYINFRNKLVSKEREVLDNYYNSTKNSIYSKSYNYSILNNIAIFYMKHYSQGNKVYE